MLKTLLAGPQIIRVGPRYNLEPATRQYYFLLLVNTMLLGARLRLVPTQNQLITRITNPLITNIKYKLAPLTLSPSDLSTHKKKGPSKN